ncbi:serine/threonine protein kinase, partial [Streptomyces virens]|uniref:serine/threonine protein kinase n=1 Tax=Streptomyces virens TaxID=285572 RepID=UPI0031F8A6F7
APRALDSAGDVRAARAGAVAAYRAGARAAARVQEAQQSGRTALPGARPAPEGDGAAGTGAGPVPPGRVADPYGVGAAGYHGAGTGAGTGGRADATGPEGPGGAGARGALEAHGAAHQAVPRARWDDLVAHAPARRGPTTALAAERARQARMAVVGPVTERWAPEQAGPVHENWQLAAPIGPATDLWALGALLFRAVQGHAPYPEESTAELVQMVCAEPPAFAEECGPLRPVVESLLRQDPTERPDFEELRGWLRSLVRSAPEPEAGVHVIAAPPVDAGRLPVIRRRGELVRRRRAGLPAHHGRHKRARKETESPRRLGRSLLLLVLLAMAAAIAYAVLFMPKAGEETSGTAGSADRTGSAGEVSEAPAPPDTGGEPDGGQNPPHTDGSPEESAASTETQTTVPEVADGFTLRKDPEGFRIAVAEGWQRTAKNGSGQVVYADGDFELIVVPGRDSAQRYGSDPMAYQRDAERELQPYRDSSWATSTGLKTIEVGGRTMAEGQFTWTGNAGELYVRNLAALIDGRYHVVQVRGPESERDRVSRLFEQASATYQYTG